MGKFVMRDAVVTINGTAISDHSNNVTIEDTADEVEFTSFTAGAYREFGQGLHDATITVSVFQDYAASSIYAIAQPIYSSGGTCVVTVKPTSAATSTTNPIGSLTARLYSFNPIAGAVGEAATTDLVFRNAGTQGLQMGTA